MTLPFSGPARTLAAIIAIAVFVTLALQTSINLERDGSPLFAFALLLRFFTIWTNFAAGLILGWVALRGRADERVLFALATAIAIVALVYHGVLAADHHPVGLDRWTNQMFHSAIPAATILWWLAFSRPSQMGWRSLPWVMVVPVVYTVFAQIVGAASGFYPYFFLDLPKLGWAMLLANLAGLSLCFLLIAALLLAVRSSATRLTGTQSDPARIP
ncbi:Pr6Pr family membrane protein [Parerythrobacter lacustris]|uniref:Pr6Pr family membrane protein n=1 Tax=Parerythrobacter lacustris TaxID=2969984 RepID=A0ABT1XSE5_9SPHN|nr:Pr6Pr family membrane protein [Parerythrobacter lacustris]MCR2834142.1 Pr6Pr family membrane protein [Parerythrobacter lacustris]